jgi:hypothetical protein
MGQQMGMRMAWEFKERAILHTGQRSPTRTGLAMTRAHDHVGIKRELRVLIDGDEVGEVSYGGRREFPLGPGTYSVQVAMDWCRSGPREVQVRPGEMVELVGGYRWRGWAWPKNFLHSIFHPKSALMVDTKRGDEPNLDWVERLDLRPETGIIAFVVLVALIILSFLLRP